jgi:hypothetical protein
MQQAYSRKFLILMQATLPSPDFFSLNAFSGKDKFKVVATA